MNLFKKMLFGFVIIAFLFLEFIYYSENEVSKNISNALVLNRLVANAKNEASHITKIDENYFMQTTKTIKTDNQYENDILNRDNNEIYKLIELKIDKVDAFLLVVYDPSKVKMMACKAFKTKNNTGKERVLSMVKRYGALAGVNGGGFFDDGKEAKDTPIGYVIKDGKIIWDYKYKRKGLIIGFSNDNKLMMLEHVTGKEAIEAGMRDGLEFGPIIIKDGEITKGIRDERFKDKASRLIIAQREDGIVLFLATNGGTVGGAKIESIIDVLLNYGAINAANLDGGASTQMVVNGELITSVKNAYGRPVKEGRMVVDGWGILP
jgi:exopolysaccharide biosynthesis protein